MRYNLLKKESTEDYLKAKELIIKSSTLNLDRIQDEYSKAFPYDYDPETTFVVKGELSEPFIIKEDFTIRFLTDREQIEKKIKTLQEGEVLEGDNIVSKPKPSPYHAWNGVDWVFSKEAELKEELIIKLAAYRYKVQGNYTYLDKHIQRWSEYDQMRMMELRKDFEENKVEKIYGTNVVTWAFNGTQLDDSIKITSATDIDNIITAGKLHEMNCRKAQFETKLEIDNATGDVLLNFDINSKFDNHYTTLNK